MSITNNLLAMVLRVMAKESTPASLVHTVAGAYNPSASAAPVTTTTTPVNVIFFDYQKMQNGTVAQDGTLIEASDKEIFVSPTGVTDIQPKADYILLNGVRWIVKNVKKHAPNGVDVVLYVLTVKR